MVALAVTFRGEVRQVHAGGGLQMLTDTAVDLAGNVWAINNWQDIDACIGTPQEGLSTRCGGQGVVIFTAWRSRFARRKSGWYGGFDRD